MSTSTVSVNHNSAFVIWLTGFSGAGKSTLAILLHEKISKLNMICTVLDGDVLRSGLNSDLGFSPQDRKENIRRIIEVAKIFIKLGVVVIVAAISPYEEDRVFAKSSFRPGTFFLCFVKCPLEICKLRDVKGLYAQVQTGFIEEFTGIDSIYEEPKEPDLYLETNITSKDQCVEAVLKHINNQLCILEKKNG